MADSTVTPEPKTKAKASSPRKPRKAAAEQAPPAKARFARALEEAKAGAEQLGHEAQDRALKLGKEAQARAEEYRGKVTSASSDWLSEAKARGDQAKDVAADMAREGKAKASEAISSLGKLVADNASLVDEKVGPKYGDYARKAASTMQDTAAKLDAKELDELGEDAKEFVRKSPGLAVGMAAVAGFMLARMFKGSKS